MQGMKKELVLLPSAAEALEGGQEGTYGPPDAVGGAADGGGEAGGFLRELQQRVHGLQLFEKGVQVDFVRRGYALIVLEGRVAQAEEAQTEHAEHEHEVWAMLDVL